MFVGRRVSGGIDRAMGPGALEVLFNLHTFLFITKLIEWRHL